MKATNQANSIFHITIIILFTLSGCQFKSATERSVFKLPCPEEVYFNPPSEFGPPKYMRDELNEMEPNKFCNPEGTVSFMSIVFPYNDINDTSHVIFTIDLYREDKLFYDAIKHNFKYFKETPLYNATSDKTSFMGEKIELLTGSYMMDDDGYIFIGLMNDQFEDKVLTEMRYQAKCQKEDLERHKRKFINIISSFHSK